MLLIVRILTNAVLLLGFAVLIGYGLHNTAIVQVMPGLRGMAPLTAVALLCLAGAALTQSTGHRTPAKALAWTGLSIGASMLAVHAVLGSDVLNPALAAHLFGYNPVIAGRTSPATAVCIVLLGVAALNRAIAWLADAAAGAALFVCSMAVIGYAYGVQDLYAVPVFNTMALHTALALASLCIASLAMRPDVGWAAVIVSKTAGGMATRRQLAFILLPPIAGGLLLRATDARHLGPGAAMAFLVTATIVPLALLILRDGKILDALQREQTARAAQKAQLADELELRLMQQAATLAQESAERAKAEAVMFRAHRMEAVGQLTGGIAHDFNNLLMALKGNLQLLSKRLPEDHPARRYADNAQQAADKGTKLTGQLLAFSRTQKLDIRPVELDPVLSNARELLGNALGPLIQVEMRLEAKSYWTSTDPDQLELAILNLALNARDAMREGGSLIVKSAGRVTRLREEDDPALYLSISVTDTGDGMTPAVAAQAIEPFFTTKERGKGTGLGLAQVYGFVRQSGGDLRITSEIGRGSTIELLLPCISAPSEHRTLKPARAAVRESRGEGQLVLVIDDDDSVRAVLVDTLRGAGFEVVEASGGEEGLRHLDTVTPDAAIIDFIMPGMNGAEVARRAQVRLPDLPIIFVSGYFDTIALDGISGAVVLRKPFDVAGLTHAVSSALN